MRDLIHKFSIPIAIVSSLTIAMLIYNFYPSETVRVRIPIIFIGIINLIGFQAFKIVFILLISLFFGGVVWAFCEKDIESLVENKKIDYNEEKILHKFKYIDLIKIYGDWTSVVFFIGFFVLLLKGLEGNGSFLLLSILSLTIAGNIKGLYVILNSELLKKKIYIFGLAWFNVLCLYWGVQFLKIN